MNLDLVAFGPHPDDVELFCGGLLAAMAARGYRVGVVDLTRGERATAGSPEEREDEARRAAEALGLVHRENLGLPDTLVRPWGGALGVADPSRPADAVGGQLARVVEAIRRLRPELLVIPHTEDRHPDHGGAGALLLEAATLAAIGRFPTEPAHPPHAPRQVLAYPMRTDVEPSLVVDTSAVVDRKHAAIRCYASQVDRPAGAARDTLVSSALTLPFIEARDRLAGARIGTAAGEPYVLHGTVGLLDPVDHFRRNATERPQLYPRRR